LRRLLACAVIFLALRRGASGVSLVSNILFAHVFVGLWMLLAGLQPGRPRRARRELRYYVGLLNPLSYRSSALYPYLTASLPAVAAAALVYFLAGLLVIRAGRGGYALEKEMS
jgi:hypothetical protein